MKGEFWAVAALIGLVLWFRTKVASAATAPAGSAGGSGSLIPGTPNPVITVTGATPVSALDSNVVGPAIVAGSNTATQSLQNQQAQIQQAQKTGDWSQVLSNQPVAEALLLSPSGNPVWTPAEMPTYTDLNGNTQSNTDVTRVYLFKGDKIPSNAWMINSYYDSSIHIYVAAQYLHLNPSNWKDILSGMGLSV